MNKRRRKRTAYLMTVILAVSLAGCGSGGSGDENISSAQEAAEAFAAENSIAESSAEKSVAASGMTESVAAESSVAANSTAEETGDEYGLSIREENGTVTAELFAMDTWITLQVEGDDAKEAAEEAASRIEQLDQLWSVGRDTSEVTRLNRDGGGKISEDTAAVLKKAFQIDGMTGGKFDITVYPLMELWGFTSGKYRVPEKSEIEALLKYVGMDQIHMRDDGTVSFDSDHVKIDFGGIAKGYTSDSLMDIFRKYTLSQAMVNLGGNVQVLGKKSDGTDWRVGIRDPDNTDEIIASVSVDGKAVITSGGYERFFEEGGERYIHILDPDTGYPAEDGIISSTIICDEGVLADGLATALYILGYEKAAEIRRDSGDLFEFILVGSDRELYVSPGIAGAVKSDAPVHVVEAPEPDAESALS